MSVSSVCVVLIWLYMCLLIYIRVKHVSIYIFFWFMLSHFSEAVGHLDVVTPASVPTTSYVLWSAVVLFVFQWPERKQPDNHHQDGLLRSQTPQSPVSQGHIYYYSGRACFCVSRTPVLVPSRAAFSPVFGKFYFKCCYLERFQSSARFLFFFNSIMTRFLLFF